MSAADAVDERAAEVLQALIRNACVNDGRPTSGHEARNADTLEAVLAGPGLEIERFEPAPGRVSLVTRIRGADPAAPTLLYDASIDVASTDPSGWSRDPFGGDRVDDEVWGRGSLGALHHAATFAVAIRHLADRGFRPDGTLVFVAGADGHTGGDLGAGHLLAHHPDAVRADWVVADSVGPMFPTPRGPALPVTVAEKGYHPFRVHVRGEDRLAMAAVEVTAVERAAGAITSISRYQAPGRSWPLFLDGLALTGLDVTMPGLARAGGTQDAVIASIPPPLFGLFLEQTRPTVHLLGVHGRALAGRSSGHLTIDLAARTFPGEDDAAERLLLDALGDALGPHPEIEVLPARSGALSAASGPLWEALAASTAGSGGGVAVPLLSMKLTASNRYRESGATTYGVDAFSPTTDAITITNRISSGIDERIDVASLANLTRLWTELATRLL